MAPAPASILTINGGSSSTKFAVYQASRPLEPSLYGKLDHSGLGGTTLSWHATESSSRQGPIEVPDDEPGTGLLIDWLEAREEFAAVTAVGHRVVHGMTHTKPDESRLKCSTSCTAQRPMHRITCPARSN
jgi:acetate kinase